MGTPSYMPPEQAAGKSDKMGPLADVYSMGAILCCLLTGRPPFYAANPIDTLIQVLEREPVPLTSSNAQVPKDLETICHKCLQKDPNRRFQSAQLLADELARFLEGRPIQSRPISGIERSLHWCRRNPWIAGAGTTAIGCVLVTIIGLAIAFRQEVINTRLEPS